MGLVHLQLPDSTVVHAIVDNNCHRCERQMRGEISMLGGGGHSGRNIEWLDGQGTSYN